ncbi:hypothetical protein CK203_116564 [Vitis vinifera]|uniref:Uncharacterized protein n=1 Tax=Vitis vinifera TaxID=29760 RepID=A0A438FDL5_VITVI|nr:hypothetical protein CK203_116564 [Vitis vinifera]
MKKPFSEVALQTRESLERPYFPLPLDPRRATEIEMGITQDLLNAVDQYLLECFEKAQLHGQTTGSTQLQWTDNVSKIKDQVNPLRSKFFSATFQYWVSSPP